MNTQNVNYNFMPGLSNNIKNIIYIIIGIIILYFVVQLATRDPKISADLKASIDSLTLMNKKLMKSQQRMDSTITAYESKIEQIDNHISNIKNKTTIINTYYNDLGQQVDQYVPNQVDSFFKQRYNY